MTKNKQFSLPFLDAQALNQLQISTQDIISCLEQLLKEQQQDCAWSAPKAVMLPEDGRYMMAALAAADKPEVLAVKTLVLNPRNPERGLPQINALVTVLNSDTGLPLAILDGNWVTAILTAGLSALAAKYMANRHASIVAFIGCGVQAHSHLQAFADSYPLQQVRLFGRGQDNIKRLSRSASNMSLSVQVCDTAQQAIRDADLIVSSVTYCAELQPFLDAQWMKTGAFLTSTDLGLPWIQNSLYALDNIVIDDKQQEAAQPNKLLPEDLINADLSDLVMKQVAGRSVETDRTGFIFRGHALGDLALSILAVQKQQLLLS